MTDPASRPAASETGAAAGVGLAVVAPLQVSLDGLFVLLLLFGLGLLMVYEGFDEYRAGRLIRDTATETVRAAAVGRTELEGTVDPDGPTLAQPFGDGECVYAHYRMQEEREDSDGDTSWTTLDADTWVVDFHLDDGTGSIRVDPEVTTTFEISDANTERIVVPSGRSEPPAVAEFLAHGTDADPSRRRRRKYVQEVLPPGETVYVLGGAELRADAEGREEDALVVRRDDGSDRFIVSDMTESELTTTLSRRAPAMILLGLAMSAGSLYLLLDTLGVG